MDGVDSVSSGLYFNATQLAAAENARKTNKKEKSGEVKKSAFATAFEKSRMEHQLQMEGFPVEIAGMEVEEAARYLKDAADIAAPDDGDFGPLVQCHAVSCETGKYLNIIYKGDRRIFLWDLRSPLYGFYAFFENTVFLKTPAVSPPGWSGGSPVPAAASRPPETAPTTTGRRLSGFWGTQ